ncbi:LysR substrate-binding domain-containing protein [Variovorax rhizosphaerae]|uniref:LysR substrate-binding domain-containing protein n=1 Tax=Variovorax rhizosphaerae TaxID=1836200 RepID=A0ABU8WWC9_9BURK
MELRHLRYFMAAAEEQHFGRAADRLHVTRPAVSQIIADLESELGTALFERLAHQVRLTAAGRALLPRLQTVMDDLHESLSLAKRVGEGKIGALNIGYGGLTLLHGLFRAAVKRFHETCPDVALSLIELSTMAQPRALAEGRIHAGFMHFGPGSAPMYSKRDGGVMAQDEAVLDWIPIQSGGLGVVVPKDHALAKRKRVALGELAHEPFVVVPRSSSSPGYGPMFTLCKEAGFEPRIVQEVSSVASQLNLVSVGIGIGLAVMGRGFSYPPSLAIIPLQDVDYVTNFVFGWVKGKRDPVLDRMIGVVEELAGSL